MATGANQEHAQQQHHHHQGHVYLWGEYGPGFPLEAHPDTQQEQAMPVGPMNASDVDAFLGRKERILGLQRDPFNLKKILRTKIGKIKKKIRVLTNSTDEVVETMQVQQQQQPEADHDSKPAQPQQQQLQQQQGQQYDVEPVTAAEQQEVDQDEAATADAAHPQAVAAKKKRNRAPTSNGRKRKRQKAWQQGTN